MSRPMRTWLAFGLAAALAAAAMGWVSLIAVRLDRAEAAARGRAEREENVRLALWRMELALAPLLAREGSRPYFAYSSFYPAERAYTRMFAELRNGEVLMPSPLLAANDPMVLLHFQIDPAGRTSSPEAPSGQARKMAEADGFAEADRLSAAAGRLSELGRFLDRRALFAELPSEVQKPLMLAQKSAGQDPGRSAPQGQPDLSALLAQNRPAANQPAFAPQNQQDKPSQQERQPAPNQQELPNQPREPQSVPGGQGAQASGQQDQSGQLAFNNDSQRTQPNNPPLPDVQQAWNSKQVLEQSENRNKYLNTREGSARYKALQRQKNDDNTTANWGSNLFNNPNSAQTVSPATSSSGSQPAKQTSGAANPALKPPAGQQAGGSRTGKQPANEPVGPPTQEAITQQAKPAANPPAAQPAAGVPDSAAPASVFEVSTGEMRPLWLGDALVLARRVSVDAQPYVQGCWLNWPALKGLLLDDVKDLLPGADLEPVPVGPAGDDQRMLAAIPARLIPGPEPAAAVSFFSPIRLSLLAAWGGMALAAAAVALLLSGAMSLSERRGAFVSAVTHELRSPLTTFRMYAEMLHEGMVPDEGRRRQYLATLRAEADRLGHLVENVLAYARLENSRHRGRAESLTLAALLERSAGRLRERAAQAGMELVVEDGEQLRAAAVRADPAAVEQILFNLVDNACKYAGRGEDRRIRLEAELRDGRACLRVRDGGPGVSPDARRKMFRPFSRSAAEAAGSAPGVGLGLALSRRLARQMGGELCLEDPPRNGACFVLELPLG